MKGLLTVAVEVQHFVGHTCTDSEARWEGRRATPLALVVVDTLDLGGRRASSECSAEERKMANNKN